MDAEAAVTGMLELRSWKMIPLLVIQLAAGRNGPGELELRQRERRNLLIEAAFELLIRASKRADSELLQVDLSLYCEVPRP